MQEELFYDSLEEDCNFNEQQSSKTKKLTKKRSLNQDLTQIVPFYGGEKSKSDININRKRRDSPKIANQILQNINTGKKSYLDMYYARTRTKQRGDLANSEGSETSRDVCGDKSPPSESEVDVPLSNYQSDPESDCDSFYKKIMNPNEKPAPKNQIKTQPAKAKFVPPPPKILPRLGPEIGKSSDKLKLLKRRQSYGQKVSAENKIKMNEIKTLRQIKSEPIKSSSG